MQFIIGIKSFAAILVMFFHPALIMISQYAIQFVSVGRVLRLPEHASCQAIASPNLYYFIIYYRLWYATFSQLQNKKSTVSDALVLFQLMLYLHRFRCSIVFSYCLFAPFPMLLLSH